MRMIPVFPLPLVLFPEALLPLHIFEPRYRQLLTDVMAGDREFGIVCLEAGRLEREIRSGAVGCLGHVDAVSTLPDGRSNILVRGVARFMLDEVVTTAKPYLVATMQPFADQDEPQDGIEHAARELHDVLARVLSAAKAMVGESTTIPEWPTDPRLLAFAVAHAIEFELSARQSLLESPSPTARLRQLHQILSRILVKVEARAEVHERASSNGHGPGAVTS